MAIYSPRLTGETQAAVSLRDDSAQTDVGTVQDVLTAAGSQVDASDNRRATTAIEDREATAVTIAQAIDRAIETVIEEAINCGRFRRSDD